MNARDRHTPVFSGAYEDTGYSFGNSAYTCCHNCARRHDCPRETTGQKCTREHRTCTSCTLWAEQGCRFFVLDLGVLRI